MCFLSGFEDSGGSGHEDENGPPVERTPLRRNGLRSLGSPMFVPANIPPESGKSSGAEDSDVDAIHLGNDIQPNRRVRFKDLVSYKFDGFFTFFS